MNFLHLQDFYTYPFLTNALIVSLLLAIMCGLMSPLIIARKNAFMGAAISHSTLFGLSIALALFTSEQSHSIFLTTLVITLFLSSLLAYSNYKQILPSDSLIGLFYTTTMAGGIIIHSLTKQNGQDLMSFLFGNILLLETSDLVIATFLTLIVAVTIMIPFKKWIFTSYDPQTAQTQGMNIAFFHFAFYILLTFVIVSSIKLAGTILIETMLLIPGFIGLKMAKNTRGAFVFSVIFSLIASILGIIVANAYSLPSGATLSAIYFLLMLVSLLIKRFIIK